MRIKRKYDILKLIKFYEKYELFRLISISGLYELRFNSIIRYKFSKKKNFFNFLKFNYIKFFCSETNKSHGVLYKFRLYRLNFRDNLALTKYSGIKKGSW